MYYGIKVKKGTKIQTKTTSGAYFTHYASSSYLKYTYVNFRAYHRRNFFLRFVDANGCAGHWKACKNYTPIGLDLNHSGAVEHIQGSFEIDITGDGEINQLQEWFAPTEGILIDTAPGIVDGVVTGDHLFGDNGGEFEDGYEKLANHDVDGDGEVAGSELGGLALWIDANSNLIVDDGELAELSAYGIVGLSVFHEDFQSTARLADGNAMLTEDLLLMR